MTRVDKTRGELVEIIGPYEPDSISYDGVYQSFLEEKRIWGKDSGRMYAHNIISWHEEEPITPEQALEFGKEFAEQWFDGFQSLVGVHIDRNHVHCHIVTNSVSYMDGHKLHNTKKDLQRMKDFTNRMCVEWGLSVAQKGRDFHGNELEHGTVSAWSKDKYHLMKNEAKNSFVADCGIACLDALETSCSREEFIRHMAEQGYPQAMEDFVSGEKVSYAGICGRADYHMLCDNGIVCYPAESVLWGCHCVFSGIGNSNPDSGSPYPFFYFISSGNDGESSK